MCIRDRSKKVYRELVGKAADIGDDNPMAYNELFALAFVAPYIASGKKIPPEMCIRDRFGTVGMAVISAALAAIMMLFMES